MFQSHLEYAGKTSQIQQNVVGEVCNFENQFNSRVVYSRKLYQYLLIQMIVISLFIYWVYASPSLDSYLEGKPWLFWLCLFISIGTATMALIFRKDVAIFPWNWVVFVTFTLSISIVCGTLVALGDSVIGLLVFSSLASMVFFLFMYSLTVKRRLTYQGSILFISASILLIFEIFTIFTEVSLFWLSTVSLFAFLLAFLLIYDTYTNVNSGDQYDVNQADEVSGSVIIYWDVILLFLKMNELIKDYLVRERN
ncbi:unnamed protein product [Paramecium primaurelia]|uniref:Uncharacterized protein n=1 Tax=Paramecium primaurelia TaxID=5886 RepID=A0A8S1N0M8_PARPR|nr:unnamed protein product [Paramecium primaurelia]